MSIITTAQAVPNRLFSLYRSLFDSENGEIRAKLEAWSTPVSLKNGGAEEDGEPSTTLFTNTLAEAKRLGLVEEDGDRLRLSVEARGSRSGKADPEERFRAYLLQTLFDPARALEAQHGNFMPAVCWFLSSNPLRPMAFSEPSQNRLKAELGDNVKRTDLTSLNRYQNLLYWVRFLGFATIVGAGESAKNRRVFPDPSKAIAGVLPEIFAGEREMTMEAFLSRLSAIYPVFEGGSARIAYDAMRLEPPDYAGGQRLSMTTSQALKRLADRQRLQMSSIADAPARLLVSASGQDRVSHIALGPAS